MENARVFIAEDRIDVGKLLFQLLKSAGHTCTWLTEITQVNQLLDSYPDYETPPKNPPFHFWVLDANLGYAPIEGQHGRDMAGKIRAKNLGGHLINLSIEGTHEVHGANAIHFHPDGDIEEKDPFQVVDLIANTTDLR